MTRVMMNGQLYVESTARSPRRFQRLVLCLGIGWIVLIASNSHCLAQQFVSLAEQQKWDQLATEVQRDAGLAQQTQSDGMTALHWAVQHEHLDSVKILLDAKANCDAENYYLVRPLAIACRLGNGDIADLLIEAGANLNSRGPSSETPLMIAARQGNANLVGRLLNAGAEVDAADRAGQTALMWASAAGNVDAMRSLVNAGADLSKRLPSGFNAFFFAVRQGHWPAVELLLNSGVDINEPMQVKKSVGRHPLAANTSALVLAVDNGHFELALKLVERGADPNDQRSGFAPLHIISWVRKPDRGEDNEPPVRGSGNIGSLQFVRELVEAGADVNLAIENGKSRGKAKLNSNKATPILYAGKTADIQLLKLLVELGADIHAQNSDGVTALLTVAGVGVTAVDEEAGTEPEVLECLKYLIGLGAEIDTVTKLGDTAMHGAAFRAFPEVIKFLRQQCLESKVWNHRDQFGWSPFDIADGKRPGSVKPNPIVREALQSALE